MFKFSEYLKENYQIDELSTDLLARYKKASSAAATAADKTGDFKKGDKRFSGIIKATKKQLANDVKEEAKDFSKYTIKPVKTEPKIVRKTNPAGRTTDHVEYEVHGTLSSHKKTFKSKKEAEAYFNTVKEEVEDISADEQFDLIEEFVEALAQEHNLDPEIIWETFDDAELLEAAVDGKGHKSSTGGLTQKGRDYYNNKYGGKLQAPVTTKPSKLKAGSKAAGRRKSFCARMSGVDGPMKDDKGRPTRKALALRKWNC